MLKRLVYISGLLLAFLAPEGVLAQDVKLEVKSPERIQCGRRFFVYFDALCHEGNLDSLQFKLPEEWPEEIRVLDGPRSSSGSYAVMQNGEIIERTVSRTYTYLMEITTPGEITLPAFKATLEGEEYTVDPVTIRAEESVPDPDAEKGTGKDSIPLPENRRSFIDSFFI